VRHGSSFVLFSLDEKRTKKKSRPLLMLPHTCPRATPPLGLATAHSGSSDIPEKTYLSVLIYVKYDIYLSKTKWIKSWLGCMVK
jgi:hypothetical protein